MGDDKKKTEKEAAKKAAKQAAKVGEGVVKGAECFRVTQGCNLTAKITKSNGFTKINVVDATATSAKAAAKGRVGGGDWVFRLDKPHKGVNYEHLNLNPSVTGKADPHLKLPPGGMLVGEGVARARGDVYCTGKAIYDDVENQTSRNTVETVSNIAGGWFGGYGGAVGGAALGTTICPGIGTILGGIIGGLSGGIGGSIAAGSIAETIGDACEYDIVEKKCKNCGMRFKIRQYLGQKDDLCDNCNKKIEEEEEEEKEKDK